MQGNMVNDNPDDSMPTETQNNAVVVQDIDKCFIELWMQANDNERRFLQATVTARSFDQACSMAGIDRTTPHQWRRRHKYFPILEKLFDENKKLAAQSFMPDNVLLAYATWNETMRTSTSEQNRLKAANDVVNHATKLAYLKEEQKSNDQRVSISTKKAYD